MKKIIGLTVAALMVMGLVGGGTWAYFSDTETSSGNILTAGTLDLNIDGGDSDIKIVDTSVSNIYPGISTSNYTVLSNAGTLGGELDITFSAISNNSASTSEYGDGSDNISNNSDITFTVWIDVNEDGTWNSGDIELEESGVVDTFDNDNTLDGGTLTNYASQTWGDIYSGNMTSGASDRFYIGYDVNGANVGNEIQEDSISWNITFTLEQPEVD
jgi:predicted ribosomally synthesized peptide with SipW-like signal peptide